MQKLNRRKQRKPRKSKPEFGLFILKKAFDGHENAKEPQTKAMELSPLHPSCESVCQHKSLFLCAFCAFLRPTPFSGFILGLNLLGDRTRRRSKLVLKHLFMAL